MSCYKIETLHFDEPMFKTIDAAYVLTLENSNRRKNYMNQLNKFKPCKTVHIQHNKGYKKCKKKLCGQNSIYDLIDAFRVVFKNAEKYKGNILILEDDFFFSNKIKKKDIDRIEDFINNNSFDLYSLGLLPAFSYPVSLYHLRIKLFGCAHAFIFSPDFRKRIINIFDKKFCINKHIDHFFNKFKVYSYFKPLCFQIFPKTENQLLWGKNYTGIDLIDNKSRNLLITFIRILNLHRNEQPGFNIFYILSILLPIIILYFFIYKIYKVYKVLYL